MVTHEEIDPYLDRLYNSTIRCPYCKAKIVRYSTTCPRCGIHKKQIYEASNIEAKKIMKERSGKKTFMIRRRPHDISFTKMCMLLIPGFLGTHNFYSGRKSRGLVMLVCTVLSIFSFVLPLRFAFEAMVGDTMLYREIPVPFPTDLFFLTAFIMWAFDAVAVIFGFYKYPVRLGEPENVKAKK